jgi:hypothetical protein
MAEKVGSPSRLNRPGERPIDGAVGHQMRWVRMTGYHDTWEQHDSHMAKR